MKTGEGGFVHRMMPPVDHDYGPIPKECYDPKLTSNDIRKMLEKVYLEPERIAKLAGSNKPTDLLVAELAAGINAEIDAETIWAYNVQVSVDILHDNAFDILGII